MSIFLEWEYVSGLRGVWVCDLNTLFKFVSLFLSPYPQTESVEKFQIWILDQIFHFAIPLISSPDKRGDFLTLLGFLYSVGYVRTQRIEGDKERERGERGRGERERVEFVRSTLAGMSIGNAVKATAR